MDRPASYSVLYCTLSRGKSGSFSAVVKVSCRKTDPSRIRIPQGPCLNTGLIFSPAFRSASQAETVSVTSHRFLPVITFCGSAKVLPLTSV